MKQNKKQNSPAIIINEIDFDSNKKDYDRCMAIANRRIQRALNRMLISEAAYKRSIGTAI